MNSSEAIVVFFGVNTLSRSEFLDDALRRRTLKEGVASILERVRGVSVGRELVSSCAASFFGSRESIAKAKAFLDESGIGVYEEDDARNPSFRAAIG